MKWTILVLGFIVCALLWVALWQNMFRPPPGLFIFYQGWTDDKNFSYRWSDLTTKPISDGVQLKEIVEFLKKENGLKYVVPISFQRFEKP